jgi:hypothetical protein
VRALRAGRARVRVDRLPGEQGDVEAERAEELGEQPVQLVTEAATATGDDLVEEGVRLEHERTAGGDVEVLEGHRAQMREAQLGKAVERRGRIPVDADPPEIRGDVHSGRL